MNKMVIPPAWLIEELKKLKEEQERRERPRLYIELPKHQPLPEELREESTETIIIPLQ